MATRAKTRTKKVTKPKSTITRVSDVPPTASIPDPVKRSSTDDKPKKKKNYDTFKKFIQDILKEIHKGGINGGALDVVDSGVKINCDKIIKNADLLLSRSKKKTLSEQEIVSAVLLTVPPPLQEGERDLAREANRRGAAAVEQFLAGSGSKKDSDKGRTTKSAKAGLMFPVSRVKDRISESSSSDGLRVGETAIIHLTAVLQYFTEELLRMAGAVADEKKHARITPRDLKLAIESDRGLKKLAENVFIPGGVPVQPKKK